MSGRCHENGKSVECTHSCEQVGEQVLARSGIIWARCPGCNHTLDIGVRNTTVTRLGNFIQGNDYFLGVSSYFKDGKMYFRVSGGETQ